MRTLSVAFIIICTTMSFFYSCHKTKDRTDNAYVDSITWSGCNFTNNILSFSFHQSGTGTLNIKSILWNFGDGSTSSASAINVTHVYDQPGIYTVTLQVNGGTTLTCTITITNFTSGSIYTVNMNGIRTWKGSAQGIVKEITIPGVGMQSVPLDTQFAVSVISAGIIKLPFFNTGLTLNLASIDTTNKVLAFIDCSSSAINLYYYYAADSIVYTDYWQSSEGLEGFEYFILHSP